MLDGEIYPKQFEPERIERPDVQNLLKKVFVHTGFPLHEPVKLAGMLDPYTRAYPDKMPAKVEIFLKNGKTLEAEKEDYYGFFTRPFSWEHTIQKFTRLSSGVIDPDLQTRLINTVKDLENLESMTALIELLSLKVSVAS